ncbi:MAG: hypothetical protein A3J66_01200 [Candidatus Magasanikbacteria bacterium RIFCSPHIGHO2_02_FULL_47_14]|uniref:Uncharacterized protein n=1 Tax=Candidatus Magasanikbacteria bacterium RIFCSPHIGHO2_02_FULL_47_14 TaxID=1798680 RepID=A0A1F6M733_9BACT|nr:MAG: hypothetical protein A3J66_01200 [Candidatus Magasanikbacteria bacterium RIFCSPHIGHO2_02_FULL_47_14]
MSRPTDERPGLKEMGFCDHGNNPSTCAGCKKEAGAAAAEVHLEDAEKIQGFLDESEAIIRKLEEKLEKKEKITKGEVMEMMSKMDSDLMGTLNRSLQEWKKQNPGASTAPLAQTEENIRCDALYDRRDLIMDKIPRSVMERRDEDVDMGAETSQFDIKEQGDKREKFIQMYGTAAGPDRLAQLGYEVEVIPGDEETVIEEIRQRQEKGEDVAILDGEDLGRVAVKKPVSSERGRELLKGGAGYKVLGGDSNSSASALRQTMEGILTGDPSLYEGVVFNRATVIAKKAS